MRENSLKRAFAAGRPVIGASLPFPCPEFVESCGFIGFDFVFIDGEHDGFSPREAQELVRAADAVGIQAVTRVPRNDAETILGYLETGCLSIIAPHVNTAEDVAAGIRATRYPPSGVRGAGSATRAASYGLTQSATQHFMTTNDQTLYMPLLEEPRAYQNIDEILQVEGLEVILLGAGDLALAMGYPGQSERPEVQALVQMALEKGRRAGKVVGTSTRDAASTHAAIERGFGFIQTSLGGAIADALRRFLSTAGPAS